MRNGRQPAMMSNQSFFKPYHVDMYDFESVSVANTSLLCRAIEWVRISDFENAFGDIVRATSLHHRYHVLR